MSYDAIGCSISQAATSVMADLVIGKPVAEAMAVQDSFLTLMQGKGTVEPDEDVLEDGIAFAGRRQVPGAREVRAAAVDGLEGRHQPSPGGASMTT